MKTGAFHSIAEIPYSVNMAAESGSSRSRSSNITYRLIFGVFSSSSTEAPLQSRSEIQKAKVKPFPLVSQIHTVAYSCYSLRRLL